MNYLFYVAWGTEEIDVYLEDRSRRRSKAWVSDMVNIKTFKAREAHWNLVLK